MKNKFFIAAKKLAGKSTHHQHKLGCVIVSKNKIVSFGFNQIKTHSRSPHHYNMIHAEVDAVLGNSYDELKGTEAYIYRETKTGSLAMSRPCPYCYEMLKTMGVKAIHYTVNEGYKSEKL
jgi:deoxycytidylate deaminase